MISFEHILFGFPGNTNKHNQNELLYYLCKTFYLPEKKNYNNKDFLSYLSLFKRQLLIQREICIAQSQEQKFIKFNPVLEIENL